MEFTWPVDPVEEAVLEEKTEELPEVEAETDKGTLDATSARLDDSLDWVERARTLLDTKDELEADAVGKLDRTELIPEVEANPEEAPNTTPVADSEFKSELEELEDKELTSAELEEEDLAKDGDNEDEVESTLLDVAEPPRLDPEAETTVEAEELELEAEFEETPELVERAELGTLELGLDTDIVLEELTGLKELTDLDEPTELEELTELEDVVDLEVLTGLEKLIDPKELAVLEELTELEEPTELGETTELEETPELVESAGLEVSCELRLETDVELEDLTKVEELMELEEPTELELTELEELTELDKVGLVTALTTGVVASAATSQPLASKEDEAAHAATELLEAEGVYTHSPASDAELEEEETAPQRAAELDEAWAELETTSQAGIEVDETAEAEAELDTTCQAGMELVED